MERARRLENSAHSLPLAAFYAPLVLSDPSRLGTARGRLYAPRVKSAIFLFYWPDEAPVSASDSEDSCSPPPGRRDPFVKRSAILDPPRVFEIRGDVSLRKRRHDSLGGRIYRSWYGAAEWRIFARFFQTSYESIIFKHRKRTHVILMKIQLPRVLWHA